MNELVRFMKQHGMPIDELGVGTTRVLIVDCDREQSANLSEILRDKGGYEVEVVYTTFETGLVSQKFAPHIMLISLLNGEIDADEICKKIRNDEDLQTIKIIAMAEHLSESEQNALLQKGFDGFVKNGASPVQIIQKIEQAIAIIY